MNILDILPCEIWCEILNYLDEIIYFRVLCTEMCKIIDTCEYINWDFRGITVNDSRILTIITNIKKVGIKDESVICWDNMKNVKMLYCDCYKRKINRDEIPEKILNFNTEHMGIVQKIVNKLELDKYRGYWIQKYDIDPNLPCQLVELYCVNTFIQDLSRLKVLKKLVCNSCDGIIDNKLPISLENLTCVKTNVVDLSHLINLKRLECTICHNIDDSKFPKSLEMLFCGFLNNIKNINYLKLLEYLNCNHCYEIRDHGLPLNLKGLYCIRTKLEDLSNLKQLKMLNCENCQYMDEEKLPQSLKRLDCMSCDFKNLRGLTKLEYLDCGNCIYLSHDNLPNGLFTLSCCFTKVTNFSKFSKLKYLLINKIVKEKYGNTIMKNVIIDIDYDDFDPDTNSIYDDSDLDSDFDSDLDSE